MCFIFSSLKQKTPAQNRKAMTLTKVIGPVKKKTDTAIKQSFKNGFPDYQVSGYYYTKENWQSAKLCLVHTCIDNVHDPKAKPVSPLAGKTLAYLSGSLKDDFFKDGLNYEPNKFYLTANQENFEEDKPLTWKMAGRAKKKKTTSLQNTRDEEEESGKNECSGYSVEDDYSDKATTTTITT